MICDINQEDVITCYYDALIAKGVRNYTFEDCKEKYPLKRKREGGRVEESNRIVFDDPKDITWLSFGWALSSSSFGVYLSFPSSPLSSSISPSILFDLKKDADDENDERKGIGTGG